MLESLLTKKRGAQGHIPSVSGPGPQTLQGSYTRPSDVTKIAGFYGEITSANFITPSNLAAALNITVGTLLNNTTPWLKFLLDGKILFVPKLPIRHTTSWQALYAAGAVYGDDTVGTYPSPTNAPVVQNARVTIGTDQFRVRLFRGAMSEPAERFTNDDPLPYVGADWNRLLYNITDIAAEGISQEGPKFLTTPYTPVMLGIGTSYVGGSTICLETVDTTTQCVVRGATRVAGATYVAKTGGNTTIGWRPVLELVQV